jgi:hypothetical protein
MVGARLLLMGLDSYHYKWQEGHPDIFLDPFDRIIAPTSRVVYQPTLLMLYALFANLPYQQQRMIWFVLQVCAFFALLLFLSKDAKTKINLKLLWIIGLIIYSSCFWRLHLERGQSYIFYALGIAIAYYFEKRDRPLSLCSGFILWG